MKPTHIIIYLGILITFLVVGNTIKPNAPKARIFGADESEASHSKLLDKVDKYTKEVQEDPNAQISLEMSVVMQDFKKQFPSEFQEIVKETNSIHLAKKLKANKNFRKIAQKRNLDLSKIHFVEKF